MGIPVSSSEGTKDVVYMWTLYLTVTEAMAYMPLGSSKGGVVSLAGSPMEKVCPLCQSQWKRRGFSVGQSHLKNV